MSSWCYFSTFTWIILGAKKKINLKEIEVVLLYAFQNRVDDPISLATLIEIYGV